MPGFITHLSLTSDAFVWTLRVLLVLAVVWAVLRWSKVATPGPVNVLRRVLTLVVVSALSVLNVAAPINAEQGWYPTVAELLGDVGPTVTAQTGTSARAAATSALTSDPAITGPRQRPPMQLHLTPTDWGGYQDFTVAGRRSGYTSTVTVWFPPSYTTDEGANREYPVIEAFHGIKPNPLGIFGAGHVDTTMQSLVEQKKMREAIIVAPHWAPDGTDNECVDTTAKGKVETWMGEDVPEWAYSTFRVQSGRQSFSTFGMSAGGWCANLAASLHPATFATAISLGGYWQPDFDPPFTPWGKGSAQFAHYDLVARAEKKPPEVAFWTFASKDDRLAYPTTAAIQKVARAPMSLTANLVAAGGHSTNLWVPHIGEALTWLAQTSPGFAPAAT